MFNFSLGSFQFNLTQLQGKLLKHPLAILKYAGLFSRDYLHQIHCWSLSQLSDTKNLESTYHGKSCRTCTCFCLQPKIKDLFKVTSQIKSKPTSTMFDQTAVVNSRSPSRGQFQEQTSTTSVPAFWMRTVSSSTSSGVNSTVGLVFESNGNIVMPACPPITGTSTSISLKFFFSATNVLARTTSSVVTPKSLLGSYTPLAFNTSAAMGTVELTGLLMMVIIACRHTLTISWLDVITIPAHSCISPWQHDERIQKVSSWRWSISKLTPIMELHNISLSHELQQLLTLGPPTNIDLQLTDILWPAELLLFMSIAAKLEIESQWHLHWGNYLQQPLLDSSQCQHWCWTDHHVSCQAFVALQLEWPQHQRLLKLLQAHQLQ